MDTTERVVFTLYQMPCCGQLLCWVNPRKPNYCPECGKRAPTTLRNNVMLYKPESKLTLGE